MVEEADDFSLLATVVFALVTFVLEMATVVAAVETQPDPSGDLWIRTALRRRAFWRFVVAALTADVLVGLGMLGLIVGGVLIAGVVGLAPQAALLERRVPLQALRRSAELTTGGRGRIRIVYSVLVILPSIPAVTLLAMGSEPPPAGQILLSAFNTTFTLAAFVALTRAYVELGGTTTPVPERRAGERGADRS